MTSGVQYTRERLAEAAALCSSIDEVIAFFGTRPYDSLPRYLCRRFDHFGIDISHFRHCGSMTRRKTRPTPEVLRAAVAESNSLTEVLRRLDRPDNGGQRAMLRAWIAEEQLSTAHFLGQAHQRGKPSMNAMRSEDVLVRRSGGHRIATSRLRRALREVGVPERCASCGVTSEWLGRPMTLEIDHIDGDWHDNRRENLRLLCPNCHAVTSTWCRGGDGHRQPGGDQ
ncbi:HNH endonuclease signature motif containing protein [Streptomyces sirii]|uniref:HNH endonuclease signature motif containing protein n=1 Tax=Streptomyces sirii TaxID=3127701 RepID=UPI003D36ED89